MFESRVVFFFIGVGFIGIFFSASLPELGSLSNAIKLVAWDDSVAFLSLNPTAVSSTLLNVLKVLSVFDVLYELLVVAKFFSLFWFPKLE